MPETAKQPMGAGDALSAIVSAVEAEEGPMTERKRRIVEAAVVTFAEQGFAATSTAELAHRAEVAEATIFRHFGSKKELLLRLVRPLADRVLVPAAIEELGLIREGNPGFRDVAAAVLKSRVAFADRYAPLLRIVAQELPLQPELRAMFFSSGLRHGVEHLRGVFLELVAAGEIRDDIQPDQLFRWFASLIVGYCGMRAIVPPGTFDDGSEIDAIVDFMVHGVRPQTGKPC